MVDYSQYFEDIERGIEEKGVVTYRSMACALNIAVDISKRALYQYAESEKGGLRSTVLKVGSDDSVKFAFQFVTVDDFAGVQKLLSDIDEKHVYALHSTDSSEHPNLAMQGRDVCQVEEAIRGSSTLSAFTTNNIGCVHMSGIDSNVRRVRASASTTSSQSLPPAKTPNSLSSQKKPTTVPTTVKENATKEKLASKANSFFANAAKTKAKKPTEAKKEPAVEKSSVLHVKDKVKDDTPTDPSGKVSKKKNVIQEEWDDEDSDDDSAKKKNGPDKEKIKKRRISAFAPKGSGGTHQSDVILDENEEGDSGAEDDSGSNKKQRKSKKVSGVEDEPQEAVTFKKHGAMDDFIEDAALREKEKAAGLNGGEIPKKVKRKKLVEKMFADEKGYLVTEMVMEEVTDDEMEDTTHGSEAPKRSSSQVKSAPAPAKKPKPTPSTTAKKNGGKSTGQQKSMMAFFGKKQ